jgi:hypothetical protein
MTLRRGGLVTVAAKGSYTAKPRPALVIQATETLPYRDSVALCLLTAIDRRAAVSRTDRSCRDERAAAGVGCDG